jgi:hypothetical protein
MLRPSRFGLTGTLTLVATLLACAPASAPLLGSSSGTGPGTTPGADSTGIRTEGPSPTPISTSLGDGWERVPEQASLAGASLAHVVWTGKRFVATGSVGDSARIFDSVDGRTWHAQPSLTYGGLSLGAYAYVAIAAGLRGVVIVGSPAGDHPQAASWSSPDGLSWTPAPDAPSLHAAPGNWLQMNGLTAAADGWVAVGEENPICSCADAWISAVAWRSPDGLHWTRQPDGADLAHAAMTGVTSGGPGFVAIGHAIDETPGRGSNALYVHPVAWTSADGASWTRVPEPVVFNFPNQAEDPITVVWNGHRVVAVGTVTPESGSDSSVVWWSDDGRSWSGGVELLGPHGPTGSVIAIRDGFMALEAEGTGASTCPGRIWASTEGSAWSCAASSSALNAFVPRAIAASGDFEIVAGNGEAPPYDLEILVRAIR